MKSERAFIIEFLCVVYGIITLSLFMWICVITYTHPEWFARPWCEFIYILQKQQQLENKLFFRFALILFIIYLSNLFYDKYIAIDRAITPRSRK